MSTYTSEPGTLLAGRYRLVDQTSVGTGWAFWKATDEPLARFVTVLTFASGFPRITEAITAARAASRLGDPRFSQVFDVEDVGELAYVVLEWVAGESLLDMLADGPLDTPNAVSLLCEAAQAIAAAHAGGLAHLRLNPASFQVNTVGMTSSASTRSAPSSMTAKATYWASTRRCCRSGPGSRRPAWRARWTSRGSGRSSTSRTTRSAPR